MTKKTPQFRPPTEADYFVISKYSEQFLGILGGLILLVAVVALFADKTAIIYGLTGALLGVIMIISQVLLNNQVQSKIANQKTYNLLLHDYLSRKKESAE